MILPRRFFLSILLFSHIFVVLLEHPISAESDNGGDSSTSRFRSYLRINTSQPDPDYDSAVSLLSSIAHSLNLASRILHYTPQRNKPILVVKWTGSDVTHPSILFNSHMDSVPAEASRWDHPPFSAFKDFSGRIFARGSQDDKCISIQQLEAIRKLKSRGFSPVRSIYLSFVSDEEVGGAEGARLFVNSADFEEMRVGLVVDEGQASPGDDYRVFIADRVTWHAQIVAKGSPGHGSLLYDNGAMENLLKSLTMIYDFRERQFDLVKSGKAIPSEVVSVNVVYLKAGIPASTGFAMNIQPSEAEMGLDVRIPPMVDGDLIRKRIAEEWAPLNRNMTFTLNEKGSLKDINGNKVMTATDGTNPWFRVFSNAVEMAGGKLSRPEILPSSTDSRFARVLGLPAFGFSPMRNTPILLHEDNEFLKEEMFLEGIKVYEYLISCLSSFTEVSSV